MLLPTFTGTVTDLQGNALAGGSIIVNSTGGTPELYADADYKVRLSNPVPLNSLGQAPAIFVADEELEYYLNVLTNQGYEIYAATYTKPTASETLPPAPVFQELQLNGTGKPNAGGKIWTYIEGSFSIPAVTYADEFGLIQNDNPVILNQDGSIPTSFFVEPGRSVNFVLTDSNDVPLTVLDSVKL